MKVTLKTDHLAEALAIASKATSKDRSFPILSSVLLDATPDGGMMLVGCDTKIRATRTVAADVDEAGMVTLPPVALGDFLAAVAADTEMSIVVGENRRATLTCGRTVVRIAGSDPEGFPASSSFDEPRAELSLWADTFCDLVTSTVRTAARDDSRPVLTGINLRTDGEHLIAETADGFRLAKRVVSLADAPDFNVIVPASRLAAVAADLGKASGDVRLAVDARGSHLLIEAETGTWAITLIDGTFVDSRRIHEMKPVTVVSVNREALLRAVKLARNITTSVEQSTSGKSVSVVISRLEIGPDSLTLRSGNAGGDHEAEAVLDAELVSGEPLSIGVNGGYLRDAVEALAGASVTLEFAGDLLPITIRTTGQEDRSQVYVVMAMGKPR